MSYLQRLCQCRVEQLCVSGAEKKPQPEPQLWRVGFLLAMEWALPGESCFVGRGAFSGYLDCTAWQEVGIFEPESKCRCAGDESFSEPVLEQSSASALVVRRLLG